MNGNRVTLRVKGLTLMGLRRGETVNVIVPVIVVGADHRVCPFLWFRM